MSFFKNAWTLAYPLLAVILATTIVFCMGDRIAATLIVQLGTLAVLVGNVLYIVFWHSKGRWRGTSPSERLKRLLTYRR